MTLLLSTGVEMGLRLTGLISQRHMYDITSRYIYFIPVEIALGFIFKRKAVDDPEVMKKINASVLSEVDKCEELKRNRGLLIEWHKEDNIKHFKDLQFIEKKIAEYRTAFPIITQKKVKALGKIEKRITSLLSNMSKQQTYWKNLPERTKQIILP